MGEMQPEVDRSVERAAKNEVVFRNANDQLDERRAELGIVEETPYFCECEEERCTTLVPLSPGEYQRVRSHANWFMLTPGHNFRSGEIVAREERFVIVEKYGRAKEIAEESSG